MFGAYTASILLGVLNVCVLWCNSSTRKGYNVFTAFDPGFSPPEFLRLNHSWFSASYRHTVFFRQVSRPEDVSVGPRSVPLDFVDITSWSSGVEGGEV